MPTRIMVYRIPVSRLAHLHAHVARRTHEKGRGEGVAVPAQIHWQPLDDLEAARSMRALEPLCWHFADPPAEPVCLHQELDAVAEAAIRFAQDFVHDAALKHAEAVRRVVRRQPREMIQREVAG